MNSRKAKEVDSKVPKESTGSGGSCLWDSLFQDQSDSKVYSFNREHNTTPEVH